MPRSLPVPIQKHELKLEQVRRDQRAHFKLRARQRFGFELSDDDCERIIDRIKKDKPGVLYLRVRGRASAWRVLWRKVRMVAIYDHRTEQLVTCYKYQKWKWQ